MTCECCDRVEIAIKNDGGASMIFCALCNVIVCEPCRIDCHGDDVARPHKCTINVRVKRTRCHVCERVFTEDDLFRAEQENGKPVAGCPSCGDAGVPHNPDDDTTITINPQDLRILTMWASNWAQQHRLLHAITPVLRRLRRQLPPHVSLTFADEVQGLRDAGFEATMHNETGEQIYPPSQPIDPHDPPNG